MGRWRESRPAWFQTKERQRSHSTPMHTAALLGPKRPLGAVLRSCALEGVGMMSAPETYLPVKGSCVWDSNRR